MKNKWIWGIVYLASIMLGNIFVDLFGIVKIWGLTFPAGVVFIGLTFSFRDYVQRNWGDWASWGWMGMASLITVLFNVKIAFASFAAFVVSEGVDWMVFKFFKKPFHQRIMFSNLLSCPLDSMIFVTLAFGWFWPAIWGQAVIKYFSGLLVLPLIYYRMRRDPEYNTSKAILVDERGL